MIARPEVRGSRDVWVTIGVAVVYAAIAWLSLQIARRPDGASPLYFGAGLALACALRYGWPALAGVLLGAVGAAVLTRGAQVVAEPSLTAIWCVVALGAPLQAWVGAALVRRFVPGPLTLAEPRDIALFLLLGAPIACLIGASLAALALGAAGIVPGEALAARWWT